MTQEETKEKIAQKLTTLESHCTTPCKARHSDCHGCTFYPSEPAAEIYSLVLVALAGKGGLELVENAYKHDNANAVGCCDDCYRENGYDEGSHAQLAADQLAHAAALALRDAEWAKQFEGLTQDTLVIVAERDAKIAALQAKLEEANKRAITTKEAEDILGVMVDHCGDCAACAGSVASRMCSGGYIELQAKLKNIASK